MCKYALPPSLKHFKQSFLRTIFNSTYMIEMNLLQKDTFSRPYSKQMCAINI